MRLYPKVIIYISINASFLLFNHNICKYFFIKYIYTNKILQYYRDINTDEANAW